MMKLKMNLRIVFSASLLLLAMLGLGACSRKSNISENPLLSQHPVLFILHSKPADVQAFVDSIAELPGDSVIIPDTVVATINDTLWCVGHFGGNAKSVQIYYWKVSDQRSVMKRTNDDIQGFSFTDTGSYQVFFHLQDGLGGRDSAGLNQWVRVINTLPHVKFVMDTVLAASKGPANLVFLALDSMGSVPSVKLDYNLDGTWDTTVTSTGSDTVRVSVAKDSTLLDSLRNQRVAIAITDDDGNTSYDTIVVHYNSAPVIFQDYPVDSSRVSIFDRFAFYWHADDIDNPNDVRYSLRVGKVPVLTKSHTVLANTRERTWLQVAEDSTLTDSSLVGNLYWQVVATDGFDTVMSPVHKFFLGDPSVKFGKINGVVRLQANSRHDGVRITLVSLKDGSMYITNSNRQYVYKGDFSFGQVEPGCYRLEARDTVGLYYSPASLDSVCVELGETVTLDTLRLLDKSKPHILLSSILDTVYGPNSDTVTWNDSLRTLNWKGIFADSGSMVALSTLKGWIDGVPVAFTNPTKVNWALKMDSLVDGRHTFRMMVADSAGNLSDTLTVRFKVRSTAIAVAVAGPDDIYTSAAVVRGGIWNGIAYSQRGDSLHFRVVVTNPQPGLDTIYFDVLGTGIAHKKIFADTSIQIGNTRTYTLDTIIDAPFDSIRSAIVTVLNDSGLVFSDTVNYQVRDRAKAGIIFLTPARDTTISLHDILNLTVSAQASEGNSIVSYEWDLDHNITNATGDGFEVNIGTNTAQVFNAPAFGVYKLKVRITDNASPIPLTASDTVLVTVLSQPPSVTVANERDTVKINGDIQLNASATDIAPGTIVKTEWKCGSDDFAEQTPGLYTAVAQANPGTEQCIVRVTDDDGETALDTTTVLVKQDPPYVHVLKDSSTVTIRDSLKLNAMAIDTLGVIAKIEWSCGTPGYGGVSNWKITSRTDTLWFAPTTAVATYYCVIRVTDDDGQTAIDTTKYKVLLDAPRVKVIDDSLSVSINDMVSLDAVAFDSLGRIIKYEWSCGGAGEAGVLGWKTYASPTTTAKMPAIGNSNYMCVIRVTDDDSTTARDTTFISVDQDAPTVNVTKKWISTRINDYFPISSEASDKFGGITGYKWSCGEPGVAGTTWLGPYAESSTILQAPATGTINYICIVEVSDADGQTARDTAHILVVQPPVSTVTAISKLPVWSGDVDVPDTNIYWHQTVSGASSVIGFPLGNALMREYWWNFSNYQPTAWFLGPADGTIDIGYADFDVAMVRPTVESSIKVKLDFRDSILPTGETDSAYIYDFFIRHLDYDSTTVQFARYWRLQGPDTIVQKATRAVSIVANNKGPFVAYRESVAGLGYVKQFNGTSWSTIGGGDFGGGAVVDSVRIAYDSIMADVYVAYRDTTTKQIFVKKSVTGTLAWTTVGGGGISVNGNNLRRIALAAKNNKVVVAWIGADSLGYAMSALGVGGTWGWNNVAAATGAATNATKSLEIALAFNYSIVTDTLAIAYTTSAYTARLRLAIGTTLNTWTNPGDVFSGTSDALSIAYAPNGPIYFAFNNRDNYGLRVRSWKGGTFSDVGAASNIGIHRVGRQTSIAVGTDGRPIVAYDDDYFAPQVNVWRFNGTSWILFGENLLPCFKSVFYTQTGYYLRANSPSLYAASNGTVYLGMMGIDGRGASGANNGPIVMKYTP